MRDYVCFDELTDDLKDLGFPNPEIIAFRIIREHGNKKNYIDEDIATKIKGKLIKAFKHIDRYNPVILFEDMHHHIDDFLAFIDYRLDYLVSKYKPLGLNIPMTNIETAQSWLREESSEGILKTKRFPSAVSYDEGREVYIGSLILMPYRKRLDNNGPMSIDGLICNNSPFLLELNHTIESLNIMTGIDRIDILEYFLCNKKPKLPRIRISKGSSINQYNLIQINSGDITKEEWLDIYDKYRKFNKRKHKKRLNTKNMELLKLIETIEIPVKPNADFYRELIKKWNKKTSEGLKPEQWRTMRRRYEVVKEYKEDISYFNNFISNIINQKGGNQ